MSIINIKQGADILEILIIRLLFRNYIYFKWKDKNVVSVKEEDRLLKKCSYVIISSYRHKILNSLKNDDVKIPTKISEDSGVGIKHVSNVLSDLKEHNLVVCINEDVHKGRLYRLTDEGKKVMDIIEKMDL